MLHKNIADQKATAVVTTCARVSNGITKENNCNVVKILTMADTRLAGSVGTNDESNATTALYTIAKNANRIPYVVNPAILLCTKTTLQCTPYRPR